MEMKWARYSMKMDLASRAAFIMLPISLITALDILPLADFIQKNIGKMNVLLFEAVFILACLIYSGRRFFTCPCCGKSINAKYDWRCDSCHKTQGREDHIYHRCRHCKEKLSTFICPFCREEFLL